MLARRWTAIAIAAASVLIAPEALADRIALLPSRGGVDPAARASLDGDLAKGLAALGHTVVPAAELDAAMKSQVTDGVADTPEEYHALGAATHADWVLVGTIEPAVTSARVELAACLVKLGRVEEVAREVDRSKEQAQVQEMLAVLVRPEGIGVGALPWEQASAPPPASPPPTPPAPPPAPPAPPPAPAEPPVPPVDGRARVAYPLGAGGDVWPPYSGGKRGFVAASVGFGMPVARPVPAAGVSSSGAAFVGALRAGYAVGDLGFEPFAELGGNLFGPRALWIDAGARWMLSPTIRRDKDGVLAGAPFFIGPELVAGAFIELPTGSGAYSAPAAARAHLGAGLDLAYALAPSFTLEARLGNLRWVPGGSGSILLAGADLGATVRF